MFENVLYVIILLHILLKWTTCILQRLAPIATLLKVSDDLGRSRMDSSTTIAGIPELLHQIFEGADKQSLARLARVSATFHQISIVYLWSAKELWDLLSLLPEGIVEEYTWKGEWVLKRAPQDSDFDRFRHYSIHVISLVVRTGCGPVSLLTTLADQAQSFFPRLRDLTIPTGRGPQRQAAECVRLAGQALRRLDVNGAYFFGKGLLPYDPDITGLFFRHLTSRTPNLTRFKIFSEAPSHTLPTALIDTICLTLRSLPHLQILDWSLCCSLPKPILAAIAAHPSISELVLYELDGWPAMHRGSLYFPSLKVVRMWCSREAGDAFAETIGYPQSLSKLDFSFFHREENISPSFFQPFSPLFQLSTNLASLRLEFGMHTMSWVQLRPLLSCRLLVELIVSTVTPIIGFNDETLKDVALSLSHLEVLRLAARHSEVSQIQVTLLGLLPLTQFTPHLHSLSITVTTRVPDSTMVAVLLAFKPVTRHPLRELGLGDSDINALEDTLEFMGTRRTAGVISSMWPSLRSGGLYYDWMTSPEPGPDMELVWDEVKEHLKRRDLDGESIPFL